MALATTPIIPSAIQSEALFGFCLKHPNTTVYPKYAFKMALAVCWFERDTLSLNGRQAATSVPPGYCSRFQNCYPNHRTEE
jgi:hypothetical protein